MLNIGSTTYRKMKRKELLDVKVTPRGDRSDIWLGIQHGELVQTIIDAVKQLFGFYPMNEQYVVSPNGAALIGGFEFGQKVEKRGKKPAAIEHVLMCSEPQEVGASIGFTHSNDSRKPLTITTGGRVFLCENGIVSGDQKVKRKHTTGLRLLDWMLDTLQDLWEKMTGYWKGVDHLKSVMVADQPGTTKRGAALPFHDDMLLQLSRQNVVPWRLLGEVDKAWRLAKHDGHLIWLPDGTKPSQWSFAGSLWDWYNAVTHIIKKLAPSDQFRALNQSMMICQNAAGITVPSV